MSETQVGEITVDERALLRPGRLRVFLVVLTIGVAGLLMGTESMGRNVLVDTGHSVRDGQLHLVRRALPGGVHVDVPGAWEIRHARVDCFAWGTTPALSWGVGYPSWVVSCSPGLSTAPGVFVVLDVLEQPDGDARPTGTGDWQAILGSDGSVREFFSPCHELVVRTSGLSRDLERAVLASMVSGGECA